MLIKLRKQILTTFVKQMRTFHSLNGTQFRCRYLSQTYVQTNCQQIDRSFTKLHLMPSNVLPNITQRRFKKTKKEKKQRVDELSDVEYDNEMSDSEQDGDLIDGKAIGFADINATLNSIRFDNIAKAGYKLSRSKVDIAFYDNMFRLNGRRVEKKSVELDVGDEIDFIRGLNGNNGDMIDITRVVVKSVHEIADNVKVKVKLRKFFKLTIYNYSNDPYNGVTVSDMK